MSRMTPNLEMLMVGTVRGSMCIIVTNFVAVGQTVAEIWRLFDFSKMAAVRHLGFGMRMFGDP